MLIGGRHRGEGRKPEELGEIRATGGKLNELDSNTGLSLAKALIIAWSQGFKPHSQGNRDMLQLYIKAVGIMVVGRLLGRPLYIYIYM